MQLTDYTLLDLDARPVDRPSNPVCCHHVAIRSKKRVYLYNRGMELLRILDLADYGIEDKRKKIRVGERDIEVADGARKSFEVCPSAQMVTVWSEEAGLAAYGFDGSLRFHLPGACNCARIDERNRLIWLVMRLDNEHVSVHTVDFHRNYVASLPMEDPFYQSSFLFEPLPEENRVAITFGGGQDGSRDCFLEVRDGAIAVVGSLPDDWGYLLHRNNGTEAVLCNFYDNLLTRVSYPGLAELGRFSYDEWMEESCPSFVVPLSDDRFLITNGIDMRTWFFDAAAMAVGEEFSLAGYEARPDSKLDEDVCTEMSALSRQDDKLIVQFSRGFNEKQVEWAAVCDIGTLL